MQGRIAHWGVLALLAALVQTSLLHAQEQTRRIRLSRDTVLAGVRCASTGRTYAELYSNGGLVECPLVADSVIEGHALPKGTWYKGWAVRFHAGGALALCYLSREATIDGVVCHAGWFVRELSGSSHVTLHPSGRLKSCRLAASVTRDGVSLKRGTRIQLTDRGGLVR